MRDCMLGPTLMAEIGRLAGQRLNRASRAGTPAEVLGDDWEEVATRFGKTYSAPRFLVGE